MRCVCRAFLSGVDEFSGRAVRDDKKGVILSEVIAILQKPGVNDSEWGENVKHFVRRIYAVASFVGAMRDFSDRAGQGCSYRMYAIKGELFPQ